MHFLHILYLLIQLADLEVQVVDRQLALRVQGRLLSACRLRLQNRLAVILLYLHVLEFLRLSWLFYGFV